MNTDLVQRRLSTIFPMTWGYSRPMGEDEEGSLTAVIVHLASRHLHIQIWYSLGKGSDAHNIFAPIYGRFTNGFHTADPKNLKALLEEIR